MSPEEALAHLREHHVTIDRDGPTVWFHHRSCPDVREQPEPPDDGNIHLSTANDDEQLRHFVVVMADLFAPVSAAFSETETPRA